MSAQVCEGCGGRDTTYQAFSGGREYYCSTCDTTFLYDPATTPPLIAMLRDGEYEKLKAEMDAELKRLGR